MLTLFGKKKKEDEKKDLPPSNVQPVTDMPAPSDTVPVGQEESPFAKIFQSISQEYQNATPLTRPESVGAPPLSVTPDWVQPRELPRSKAMVIMPPGSSKSPKPTEDESWENNEDLKDEPVVPQTSKPQTPVSSTPKIAQSSLPNDDEKGQRVKSTATQALTENTPQSRPSSVTKNPDSPGEHVQSTPKPPEKTKRDDEKQVVAQTSPSFKEGVSTFDSSGEFSLSGFDDLSKLLAETDSVLTQGREKEKELAVEKPLPPRKQKDAEAKKEPEKLPSAPTEKQAGEKPKLKTGLNSFEHIAELTQGAIDTTGLVMIDGGTDSGRTTLCLGLIDRYLKQGSPCIFVTYSQSPQTVREELKKLGCDVAQYESNYRFMIVDAYTAQSGGFSMEIYSLLEPWDIQKLQESLIGNSGMFIGEKVRIVIDDLDDLVSKVGKDFGKQFDPMVGELKKAGATVIATADITKAGKELKGWAEEDSDVLLEVDLEKGKEHSLTVSRLKGSKAKTEAEEWNVQPGKGIVFVQ